MSLDLEIQTLLRSPQVSEINFTMRGIRVTGQGFRELSNCFFLDGDPAIRHRIRVTVRPELVLRNAEAQYDDEDDKLNLRSMSVLDTAPQRAVIVHECTHAQIDLRAASTSIRSDEGAAYIAEAWYMLASNVDQAAIDQQVTSEIREIAADLRSQSLLSAPVEASADQINTVRRVMATTFRYETGHYISDGIRGHRYRGE